MKTFFLIILIALVFVGSYFGYNFYLQNNVLIEKTPEGTRIEGRITDFYNDLSRRGNCGIILGDTKIVIRIGEVRSSSSVPSQRGKIDGVNCQGFEDDLSDLQNERVEFFGSEYKDNEYTIEGRSDYFLRVY